MSVVESANVSPPDGLHRPRQGPDGLRTGAAIQFAACAIVYFPLALAFESLADVRWTSDFVFALGWSVIVLSVGALIRRFDEPVRSTRVQCV